jgi:lipopolysaccharide heptosyltransferase III
MTPCLNAIREWRPSINIAVVIEPLVAPLLEDHPSVDRIFQCDKSIASRLRVIREVRREQFDLAINLHGGSTAMMITAMAGAVRSVGFRGNRNSGSLSDQAPNPDVILDKSPIHSVEQQLSLLNWIGIPMPERPRLSLHVSKDAGESLDSKLHAVKVSASSEGSSRFAIVAPGAAFESKRWHASGFTQVVDWLKNTWKIHSLIVAGPGQEVLAREVARNCDSKTTILSGLNLPELMALMRNYGRVFVGNDSGPMHIAAAFGCPIVAIFGSSNPDVWRPWTDSPCRVLGGERGVSDNNIRGSISNVKVSDVLNALDEVLRSVAAQAAS